MLFGAFVVVPALSSAVVWQTVLKSSPAISPRTPEEIIIPVVIPEASEPVETPVRISIPSVHVDAAIEKVALTPDGSMDVPKEPANAGWYELGPRPGEVGAAVLAGHVDWYDGVTGVFADLHEVEPGDIIVTTDEAGNEARFVVRESKTYAADAVATDVFVSTDGAAHLNLITCIGDWDTTQGQYTERLVVFADKVAK